MTVKLLVLIASILHAILCDNIQDLCTTKSVKFEYDAPELTMNCSCKPEDDVCVRKCCKPGYYLKEGGICTQLNRTNDVVFKLPVYNQELERDGEIVFQYERFLVGPIECNYYQLNPANESDQFYVRNDGRLLWKVENFSQIYNNDQFCVDSSDNVDEKIAYVCFDDEEFQSKYSNHKVTGMIISMPFLLATLIVYALLPERNLHMKALMFYVFSLLMAYICLVILQLNTKEIPKTECQVIAFFTFFFFMASFFWMNVICLDIWFTFSGLRGFNGSKRSAERKRLLFYCAYAWGLTIALSTTVFLINNLGNAGAWYHPNIGNGRCWFEHDYQQLFYFYGPMAVLIFANVVLFCLTAYKIRQSQNETKMLRRDDSKRHAAESDQQKFYLYMKLFLAMGVNWTMEFLSWIIEWKVQAETKYMFYVTDFCNAIYGVFIFFLFVCKMKIWCLLKKRYYTFMGKPYFARETTLRTHSSNFSGTESTMFSDNDHNRDSRPLRLNSMK